MHLVLFFSLFTSLHFTSCFSSCQWIAGFLPRRRREEEKNTTWNGKVSWVRKFTHGLFPPFFDCKKFYTTRSTRMDTRVRGIYSTNECELLLKMAFSTVTWFYLCFKKRDTRKFVVFVIIARHMFHCSRLHNFFLCHLIRIESKIYAYVPNAHMRFEFIATVFSSIECTNVCVCFCHRYKLHTI